VSDIRDKPERTDDSDGPKKPPPIAPGVIDEWVAWNVRMHRENRGWSQADLAEKMAALGWKYHPQTVHRVESGQRKVTIGEAEALARLFSTTVDALTWPDMVTHTSAWLDTFTSRADLAFNEIGVQTRELLFDREHLERALAQVEQRGLGEQADEDSFLTERINDARAALETATPEEAVQMGREEYEHWRSDASDDTWDIAKANRFPNRFPRAPWLEVPDGEG
jgi:transcriptional regulator with XRE-family HTH domain